MIAVRAPSLPPNPPAAEAEPPAARVETADLAAALDDNAPIQIDYSHIETEDDTPVDNLLSEREQRLLADTLYASWSGPGADRTFMAMTNVGLFYALHAPPYVPDAMISFDVRPPSDLRPKQNRSYFIWEYGKPPEIVVEVVSNRKGGELDEKLVGYARLGITFYVVFDPYQYLGQQVLRVFARRDLDYTEISPDQLPGLGLGVTLWEGEYEDMAATWLRWVDGNGNLLLTGRERADQESARAEQESLRAEQERTRAEHAYQRVERLAAMLRELGVDPDAA
jgi:Uma2 family endonuclease